MAIDYDKIIFQCSKLKQHYRSKTSPSLGKVFTDDPQIIIWDTAILAMAQRGADSLSSGQLAAFQTAPQLHITGDFEGFFIGGHDSIRHAPTIDGLPYDCWVVTFRKENNEFSYYTIAERVDGNFVPEFLPFAAAVEFLTQPFIALSDAPLQSKKGRAIKQKEHISKFSVINLRRREQNGTYGKRHVDWQHSWIVSGHWRRQYHPSTGEHKPKFINPYVKGDGPLLAPKQTIYKVDR